MTIEERYTEAMRLAGWGLIDKEQLPPETPVLIAFEDMLGAEKEGFIETIGFDDWEAVGKKLEKLQPLDPSKIEQFNELIYPSGESSPVIKNRIDMEKGKISIWIANLAKYTEGNLDGQWVELPKSEEELRSIINSISNNGKDEVMIFDFDIDENLAYLRDDVSEYSNIYELNILAQLLALKEEHPGAELYISHAGNLTIGEICNVLMQEEQLPYMEYEFEGSDNPEVMRNMSSETKLGYTLLESNIALKKMLEDTEIGSSTLNHYIDVEGIGRDMILSGYADVGEDGWYDPQATQPELEKYTMDDIKKYIKENQEMEQKVSVEPVITSKGPKL